MYKSHLSHLSLRDVHSTVLYHLMSLLRSIQSVAVVIPRLLKHRKMAVHFELPLSNHSKEDIYLSTANVNFLAFSNCSKASASDTT